MRGDRLALATNDSRVELEILKIIPYLPWVVSAKTLSDIILRFQDLCPTLCGYQKDLPRYLAKWMLAHNWQIYRERAPMRFVVPGRVKDI